MAHTYRNQISSFDEMDESI